ncbi:MAG: hypothetical protein M1832_006187 [Thelocarpon impressellum]|nr:MAG: hypothetical protein M1832_006187 [Thelocarpon impressellum]
MDILLGKVTQQAMNYAIRSGITITSTYAIRQCSRLLKTVKGSEHEELSKLQERLDSKIRIVSPAIDMIELISARGNSSLESAVTLTKALRWEIQSLGLRLAKAANSEEQFRRGAPKAKTKAQNEIELKLIIRDIRNLLERIEDAVPLINLAITTSGASLSTSLPATISPSRLLQASTFLTAGDTQFSVQPNLPQQIGPDFTLSLYMLFSGHSRRPAGEEGTTKETMWKEVIHKGRIKLLRVPLEQAHELPSSDRPTPRQASGGGEFDLGHQGHQPSDAQAEDHFFPPHVSGEGQADEFAYQLLMIEDLDDDRVHTFDDGEPQPGPYDDVQYAGIREVIPIHEIAKIFYADTGKILNIGSEGEANNPVLLLKRDVNAVPPRRMTERVHRECDWYDEEVSVQSRRDDSENDVNSEGYEEPPSGDQIPASPSAKETLPPRQGPWRLPTNLDPEWMAFEVYVEEPDSDTEDDTLSEVGSDPTSRSRPSREASLDGELTSALSSLHLDKPRTPSDQQLIRTPSLPLSPPTTLGKGGLGGPVRTSLSLLETLIRLTALQQFQQTSHLSITDELLNFFLSESSTTGAGNDGEERRRKRWEARRRLGFDPYDDSPVKRRIDHGVEERTRQEGSYIGEEHYDYYDGELAPNHRLSKARNANQGQDSISPSPLLLKHRTGTSEPSPSTPRSLRSRPLPQHLRPRPSVEMSSPPPSLDGASPSRRKLRSHMQHRPSSADSQPASSPVAFTPDSPSASTSGGGRQSEHNPLYMRVNSQRRPGLRGVAVSKNTGAKREGERASPLGRGASVETDSTLGTSPGYDDDAGLGQSGG